MRKKHKIYQSPTVRIEPIPKAFTTSVSINNLQEQKARFLKHGKTPSFVVEGDTSTVEELAAKTSGKIRFELLGEAEYILNTVKQKYGKGENYLEHIYGPRIEQKEANEILFDYIGENSLQESLAVYWSKDMPCSARMVWKGYSFKCNRPEARRYALWINATRENPYLRRQGLHCLLDHEIGTHFYRSYNDGFQPWFYDRKKFGLRGIGSFESLCTEEGLAAVNTTLRAKEKYLWLSALTYYTACKSTEMSFKQLFDHLEQFVDNPEQRWKHVMRVKRGLVDPNDLGGYGKDQCYFEGAVCILRNLDIINFQLLMSGKICYDEVTRVRRLARLGSVCLPAIMRDMDAYRKQLKKMATINGLHLEHPAHQPCRAYVQRLKERQTGVQRKRKVRKSKKTRSSPSKLSGSLSEQSQMSSQSAEMDTAPADLAGSRQSDRGVPSAGKASGVNTKGSSGTPDSSSASAADSTSQLAHHGHHQGMEDSGMQARLGGSKGGRASGSGKRSLIPCCSPGRRKNRPHTAVTVAPYIGPLPPLPPSLSREGVKSHSQTSVLCLQPEGAEGAEGTGGFSVCGDCSSGDDHHSLCTEDLDFWLSNLTPPSSLSPSSSPSPSPCTTQNLQVSFPSSLCLPPPSPQFSLPPVGQEERVAAQALSGGVRCVGRCTLEDDGTCDAKLRTAGRLAPPSGKQCPKSPHGKHSPKSSCGKHIPTSPRGKHIPRLSQ